MTESFSEFKNSFFYGSRVDLNFKFLKELSDEEASAFFQELLWKLGDSFNSGNYAPILEHVVAWQQRGYDGDGRFVYDDAPFTPLKKPLSESRLALLTSSGHFGAGDDPEPFGQKEMTQTEAMAQIFRFLQETPTLSTIPIDTPLEHLRVRHGGYDIRGAEADANVAFPLTRLQELAAEGVIGELANHAYSFVGACAQTPLIKKTAPQWVKQLQEQQVDAVLLVPV